MKTTTLSGMVVDTCSRGTSGASIVFRVSRLPVVCAVQAELRLCLGTAMQDTAKVLQDIVGRLKHLPISRIIAFDQRLHLKSGIRGLLRDINPYRSIDLLVYSESEFAELRSQRGCRFVAGTLTFRT